MRQFSTLVQERFAKLIEEGVLAWCVAIEAAPAQAFYLTTHRQSVTFSSQAWNPWPMKLGRFHDSGTGDLPTTELTISNIGRLAMPYLEARSWDEGDVQIILVFAEEADAIPIALRMRFAILAASAKQDAITLTLGQPSFWSRQFPGRRYIRDAGFPGILRNVS